MAMGQQEVAATRSQQDDQGGKNDLAGGHGG